MARSLFGGSSDDYAVDSNGRPVAGRRVRFYTSAAMSTEITDLASDAAGTGTPLTVTTDTHGYWGPVYGPDAVTVMYAGTVDAAGNPPTYVVAIYTHTATGGGSVSDADATTKGILRLAGDLGGTATTPTVPGLSTKQPLDADLTALAALDSSTSGAIASDGAGWIKKTYAQLKTALGITTSDVSGLGTAATVNTGTTSGTIPLLSTGGVLPIARLATGTPDGTKFVRDDGTLASAASPAIKDEGTTVVATPSAINFVGAGVTASDGGSGTATVTIPGGGGISLTDRGAWATTTAYVVGDTVTQNNHRYICAAAHTSGTFATDLAAGKWVLEGDTGALIASNNLSDVGTVATARTNLGLGTAATHPVGDFAQTANNLSDLASATTARTNLGLAALATKSAAAVPGDLTATGTPSSTTFLRGDGAWATPAGGGSGFASNLPASGRYITPPVGQVTTWAMSDGTQRCAPIFIPRSVTATRIGVSVTGAGTGSSVIRLGIYSDNNGVPDALVLDAGTVSGTATGYAELTISQALAAGVYYLTAVSQSSTAAPTVQASNGRNVFTSYGTNSLAGNDIAGFQNAGTTSGALPANWGSTYDGNTATPRLLLKVS